MATAFQIAKLNRRFALLDVDASGFLELSDYLRIADRLADAFGRDRDDATIAALRGAYTAMWGALLRSDRDGDGRVDLGEFRTCMDRGLIARPANFDRAIGPACELLVDAADLDGDGRVDDRELRLVIAGLGVAPDQVDIAVAHVAGDGHGLGKDAFVRTCREYYVGADTAAAGNWLLGDVAGLATGTEDQ